MNRVLFQATLENLMISSLPAQQKQHRGRISYADKQGLLCFLRVNVSHGAYGQPIRKTNISCPGILSRQPFQPSFSKMRKVNENRKTDISETINDRSGRSPARLFATADREPVRRFFGTLMKKLPRTLPDFACRG